VILPCLAALLHKGSAFNPPVISRPLQLSHSRLFQLHFLLLGMEVIPHCRQL
jgi:hypothetical protein